MRLDWTLGGQAKHAAVERKLHEHISTGPFINRLIASFQDPWALILVLEYAPCGDLFQAMNFHGLPTRNDAVIYAIQVATALEHLHALGGNVSLSLSRTRHARYLLA